MAAAVPESRSPQRAGGAGAAGSPPPPATVDAASSDSPLLAGAVKFSSEAMSVDPFLSNGEGTGIAGAHPLAPFTATKQPAGGLVTSPPPWVRNIHRRTASPS